MAVCLSSPTTGPTVEATAGAAITDDEVSIEGVLLCFTVLTRDVPGLVERAGAEPDAVAIAVVCFLGIGTEHHYKRGANIFRKKRFIEPIKSEENLSIAARYIKGSLQLLQWAAAAQPNAALILIAIGAIALSVEFLRPGLVFPGVTGAVLSYLGLLSLAKAPASPVELLLLLGWLGTSLLDTPRVMRLVSSVSLLAGILMIPAVTTGPALCATGVLAGITGVLLPLARRARRNKTKEAVNAGALPIF